MPVARAAVSGFGCTSRNVLRSWRGCAGKPFNVVVKASNFVVETGIWLSTQTPALSAVPCPDPAYPRP